MKTNNVDQPEVNILRNAMLFSLTTHSWRNRRQADSTKITADCDAKKLNTTKRLMESEKFDALHKHLNLTYNWCLSRAMFSCIRRGVYFVKRTMVPEFEAYLDEANKQLREKFVPEFVAEYQACKEKSKLPAYQGGLGVLYDEADYPTTEALTAMFSFEWSWLALSVPDELPEEVRVRECAKLRESFFDAQTEVRFALREGFKGIIDNALELLETKPGEKPRRFTDATVGTFEKFFETFNARNMMEDKELETVVAEARKVIGGITDTKSLRDSETLRQATAKQFEKVGKVLSKLVAERPTRRFQRDEE